MARLLLRGIANRDRDPRPGETPKERAKERVSWRVSRNPPWAEISLGERPVGSSSTRARSQSRRPRPRHSPLLRAEVTSLQPLLTSSHAPGITASSLDPVSGQNAVRGCGQHLPKMNAGPLKPVGFAREYYLPTG